MEGSASIAGGGFARGGTPAVVLFAIHPFPDVRPPRGTWTGLSCPPRCQEAVSVIPPFGCGRPVGWDWGLSTLTLPLFRHSDFTLSSTHRARQPIGNSSLGATVQSRSFCWFLVFLLVFYTECTHAHIHPHLRTHIFFSTYCHNACSLVHTRLSPHILVTLTGHVRREWR